MSRLTERKEDLYGNKYIATGGGAYFEEESVYEALEKLAHYEDLEEQGRLIEQKYGRWIRTGAISYRCSECNYLPIEIDTPYCPRCGAKMMPSAKLAELKGSKK